MTWIAPPEKDTATDTLEKRLWDAADQSRANSGLKAQEYSAPVLGLIFLRFAEVRFNAHRAKLDKAGASARRGNRVDEPATYHAEGILYLPAEARFDFLLNLPEAENIGAKVNAAMRAIEQHNPQLAGVLPKTFNLFTSSLLKQLLKRVSEIPATVDYDAFGRIYEYFLGEFARTEGQKGGEFYTPASIVRLLVEVIEPYHGRVLDPACGSGGMFVQSARFVAQRKAPPPSTRPAGHPSPSGRRAGDEGLAAPYSGDPSRELAIHGVEKTDDTGRLCRLNLAVHGLEGDIRHGGNVNSYYDDPFDACGAGIESAATASRHPLPVGEGRGEGKQNRADTVLFIDARHIYRQVARAHREWTPAQIGFLANVVRLYRGEALDFTVGGNEAKAKLTEVFGKQPKYADVPGLCRTATLKDIEAQGWSLNPGRCVGVEPGEAVSDEDFKEQLETLNEELETLNAQARDLEQTIAGNVAEILEA